MPAGATLAFDDLDTPDLDAMFTALADPTRRSIVAHLTRGEATVNELAEPFAISVQAVSKHIQVLERAGLVARGRHRQTRPCRLVPETLRAATDWIDEQRRLWTERFDQLEQHLIDMQSDRQSDPQSDPQTDRNAP